MRQIDFVKTSGVSQSYLSQVERGDYPPSAEILIQVERLGYTAKWLMTGEPPERMPIAPLAERVAEPAARYGEEDDALLEIAEITKQVAELGKRLDRLTDYIKRRKT